MNYTIFNIIIQDVKYDLKSAIIANIDLHLDSQNFIEYGSVIFNGFIFESSGIRFDFDPLTTLKISIPLLLTRRLKNRLNPLSAIITNINCWIRDDLES
jgi:hypothetical protein